MILLVKLLINSTVSHSISVICTIRFSILYCINNLRLSVDTFNFSSRHCCTYGHFAVGWAAVLKTKRPSIRLFERIYQLYRIRYIRSTWYTRGKRYIVRCAITTSAYCFAVCKRMVYLGICCIIVFGNCDTRATVYAYTERVSQNYAEPLYMVLWRTRIILR